MPIESVQPAGMGWSCPQMLTWYGASARGARARRSYDRIMNSPR